jgi:hypothetical protein
MPRLISPLYTRTVDEPAVLARIERVAEIAPEEGQACDVDQTFTVENRAVWVKQLQPMVLPLWNSLAERFAWFAVITRADWRECKYLFGPEAGGSSKIHYYCCSGLQHVPPGHEDPLPNEEAEWHQKSAHVLRDEWRPTLEAYGIHVMDKTGGFALFHHPEDDRAAAMMAEFIAVASESMDISSGRGVLEVTAPGLVFDKARPVLHRLREQPVRGLSIIGDGLTDWRMVTAGRAMQMHPDNPLEEVTATSVGAIHPTISRSSDLILHDTHAALLYLQKLEEATTRLHAPTNN